MSTMATMFKPGDYKTDIKPVWCPGCGDYGVLNALYRAMSTLNIEPWNTAVISGIGCSSRLPGYVNAYGFNGIHGRALTLATGVKVARPDLTVIAVGGEVFGWYFWGDNGSYTARRGTGSTDSVMDNEIYGLTKGQVAPTTPTGDKTKSTFWGNPEPAVDPCELAISTGATWVGRGFSGDMKFLVELIVDAMQHTGFSFLNVMSPCVTFRGDDQFKVLKEKLKYLPEGYDPGHRANAMVYTRETDVLTTGVLYRTERPSLNQQLASIRERAKAQGPDPSVRQILETFYPKF